MKEITITLSALEAEIVKSAMIERKDLERRCVTALKNVNVTTEVSEYEKDIRAIESVLKKIKGAEWDTSAKNG